MKKNKKLLAIYLNEFNYTFLKKGLKYNLPNIKRFFKYKKIQTTTVDKIQDKNLDPWVQNVSINVGKASKKHKILKLGQRINQNQIQIWDLLTRKKIKCGIWGLMNARYKKNKNLKVFFPDPWNHADYPYPTSLQKLFLLPKSYAQKYSDFKLLYEIKNIFNFLIGIYQFGIFSYLFKNFFFLTKIFLTTGFKNYFLFFLFDIISLEIYRNIYKNKKIDFSFIFLNSLAHFQHNNWDEKINYKKYYIFVDEILRLINQIYIKHDSIIIFNGMTQKKIHREYIIKAKNFEDLFNNLEIDYKKIQQNMTNGGFLYFKNKNIKSKAIKKLQSYYISNCYIFEIKNFNDLKIYFRIQIKSKEELKNLNSKNLTKSITYEKNYKTYPTKKHILGVDFLLDNMSFIKTTGKHTNNGNFFYENLKINKKKIHNLEIFSIIKNYYLN